MELTIKLREIESKFNLPLTAKCKIYDSDGKEIRRSLGSIKFIY